MIKCKKTISIAMSMVVMATAFSTNVFAGGFYGCCLPKSESNPNYNIELLNEEKPNVTFLLNIGENSITEKSCGIEKSCDLEIKGYGKMNDFSSLTTPPWYFCKNRITSIKIGDGITRIGKCAFCDCKYLTNIDIPDSVEEIGRMAFSGCSDLRSVTIGKSVKNIDGLAFWECKSLTCVTYYGETDPNCDDAFEGCTQLKEVYVPSNYRGDTFCGIKVTKGKI